MRWRLGLGVGAYVVLVAACSSGDTTGAPDAESGGDGGAAGDAASDGGLVASPAAPAAAAVPMVAPCPTGWREVADAEEGGPATCDPWPASGVEVCTAPGEAHLPGEPGCASVGAACPAGDWPDSLAALPAGTTIAYVQAGAPAGGMGTRAAPYATITEALATATAGTVTAVARGTYSEAITLRAGVRLFGACAGETRIESATGSLTVGTVQVSGLGAELRDVSVGGARPGVLVTARASVTLAGVIVERATFVGLMAVGAGEATGDRVVVRDTQPTPDGMFGRGVECDGTCHITLRHALIANNQDQATIAAGGTLELEDVAVVGTSANAGAARGGGGIAAQEGGTLVATRAVVDDNDEGGVLVTGVGTTATLTGVVVRGTHVRADGSGGRGVELGQGASATLRGVTIEHAGEVGLAATGAGTMLDAEDVVVRDMDGDGRGAFGRGVMIGGAATARGARWWIERAREIAIAAMRATLAVEDVTIHDTLEESRTAAWGRAFDVETGATVTATRVDVARAREAAVFVQNPGTVLTLVDARIEDTLPRAFDETVGRPLSVQDGAAVLATRLSIARGHETGILTLGAGSAFVGDDVHVADIESDVHMNASGRGIYAQDGATVTLHRAIVERVRELGVTASREGTSIVGEDVVVRDVEARASDGYFGRGVAAQYGATIELTRAIVSNAREAAVSSIGEGSRVALTDVVVSRTRERACASGGDCPGAGAGFGVSAFDFGVIDVMRFDIAENATCGVQIAPRGTVNLHNGTVRRNPIGANIQDTAFDLSRLMDGVLFLENERALDTAELPVPDTATTL